MISSLYSILSLLLAVPRITLLIEAASRTDSPSLVLRSHRIDRKRLKLTTREYKKKKRTSKLDCWHPFIVIHIQSKWGKSFPPPSGWFGRIGLHQRSFILAPCTCKKLKKTDRPREPVKNDEPKRQEIGLDRVAICWTRFPRLMSQWLKAR